MRERIFLTYTNASALPYHGAVLGHHVVLNYIDSNGVHDTLEGVPERKFNRNAEKLFAFLREERLSDGIRNTDSPFRRLRAKDGEGIGFAALDKPHTMIASGDDLSSQWGSNEKIRCQRKRYWLRVSSNFPKQQFICSRSLEGGRLSRARYSAS
jgi:hypothetical protein